MAAGRIAPPGSPLGPCAADCSHTDCKASRSMAETICLYCRKPIGYERRFYDIRDHASDPHVLVHASCREDAVTPTRSIELDPDAGISDADPGL